MKIENTTDYCTRTMRSLICAVHNHIAKTEGKYKRWRHLRVAIKPTRQQRGASGHAYYYGTYMQVNVTKTQNRHRFIQVVYHELMHIYGYRHGNFSDVSYAEIESVFGPDADLPKTTDRPAKPRPDIRLVRYKRLVSRQQAWQAKLRRAQNALKKLKGQVRYYEKTLPQAVTHTAASNSPAPQTWGYSSLP